MSVVIIKTDDDDDDDDDDVYTAFRNLSLSLLGVLRLTGIFKIFLLAEEFCNFIHLVISGGPALVTKSYQTSTCNCQNILTNRLAQFRIKPLVKTTSAAQLLR